MICVRLEGGLGNQFFQYAAARSLALRRGAGVLLDTSAYGQRSRRYTFRPLELHGWRIEARNATVGEMRALAVARCLPLASRMISGWQTYVERQRGYEKTFPNLPDQTYLVGYWQSPHYFSDHATAIADEIQPLQPLSRKSRDLVDHIGATTSVAVHVRRGDYVTLPSAAAYHGALSLPYYTAAINRIRFYVTQPRFYVFSDDPEWSRAHLPLSQSEAVFVDHNQGSDAWQDLILMSHSRHHIIANSSFSWWGAWLADQRYRGAQRHVIAPARWFAGRADGIADRLPSHWHPL
jgi:hypothetical protein